MTIELLLEKGVRIPCPQSVEIGSDLDPEKISGDGVTIHPGCRLHGTETRILPGCELGREAPVFLENVQLGRGVRLFGGAFYDCTMLHGAEMGLGAHVRSGTLLEEGARGAHTVGLKQTILLPFVTLGSLINFCDVLMAGGTDEKNHSEVGSSYIHFNYTPNQDKATPSLVGDVPRGVMLREAPIFLGGQGGMVGPVRVAYGVIVAAGTILRREALDPDTLVLGEKTLARRIPFHRGLYRNVDRLVDRNLEYIGNLAALRAFYRHVRIPHAGPGEETDIFEAAMGRVEQGIAERRKRLGQLAGKMPASIDAYRAYAGSDAEEPVIAAQQALHDGWPAVNAAIERALDDTGDEASRDVFLAAYTSETGSHLERIRALTDPAAAAGVRWLEKTVAATARCAEGGGAARPHPLAD